ncbi:MAG: hypothetical protein ACRD0Q_01380 [Acidimicrobiales bacterium]
MSRRAAAASDPELTVWVGWDDGLGSFFAQVVPPGDVDDDGLLLWVGTTPAEIVDVANLASLVSPWTELGPDVLRALEADRWASTYSKGPDSHARPIR